MLILTIILLPMLLAPISWLLGRKTKKGRDLFVVCAGLCELALGLAAVLRGGTASIPALCVMGLQFEMDGFRSVYTVVLTFMWAMTLLFSPDYFAHHHKRNRYYFFQLLTLGATLGVFLAADLYTAFIFFEIMSFTSFTWVIQEETEGAIRAAKTYLAVAVIGGLVALMGLFLIWKTLGTLTISELYPAARAAGKLPVLYTAAACILFGFGAKAGMYPVHIWLPKAHPVAPAPASALLSGALTKSGVWGILVISCNLFRGDPVWGTVILSLGAVTMLLGAVLALFSIDLKRTLACSSMSQIGFILTGIGMMGLLGEENALAARGTVLHMVNHSAFKLVLFLCAGSVFRNLHKLDLNEIRGFGRKKPLLKIAFVGALIGFLWYNSYPAQVFMGDTGSLTIGGIIGVSAVLIRKELLLPLLCGIFFVESLSVILQRVHFKRTRIKYGKGRRIWTISPLHHHFQAWKVDPVTRQEIIPEGLNFSRPKPNDGHGFHEVKVTIRFWIVQVLLAVATLALLKIR